MKSVCVILLCLVAVIKAAPQDLTAEVIAKPVVQLLRSESVNNGRGSYRFSYEQTDGTKREEHGELKNAGTEDEELEIVGSYEYIAPEGEGWLVTFIANKLGFQPTITQKGVGVAPVIISTPRVEFLPPVAPAIPVAPEQPPNLL